jgi:membrane protein implicated in regulation of membrane protease activity
MTGLGGGGFIWLIIVAALVIVPLWRLLPKFGIPSWVSLVAIVPFGVIILLWVMAFRDRVDGGTR